MNVERPRLDFPGGLFAAPPTLAHLAAFPLASLSVEPAIRRVTAADGRVVTLEPLVMQVLVALAGANGEPLSRDDLVSACWGRRIVGDDAINRAISHLRRDLAGIGDRSVRIETISKVGYRLLVSTEGEGAVDAGLSGTTTATLSPSPPSVRRGSLVLAAVALVCAGGAALAWTAWPQARAKPVTIAIEPAASSRGDVAARTLASDLTGDVSRLAGAVTQLRMVDGDVGSGSADMLIRIGVTREEQRLTARLRLVDTGNGAVIWSRDIRDERGSPALLRDRTATTIAGVVRCGLERTAGRFEDPVSLRLFFQACDAVERGDWPMARSFAQQIVARHPDDATGLACLAMTTIMSAIDAGTVTPAMARTAEHYARRAIASDPRVGRGYQALALVLGSQNKSALAVLERGVAADPENASIQSIYALSLFNAGYVKASVDPALRSVALNPASRFAHSAAVRRLLAAGRTAQAQTMQARIEETWGIHPSLAQERVELLRFHPDPRAALIAFDRIAESKDYALDRLELEFRADPAHFDWDRFDAFARQAFAEEPASAWHLALMATRMGDSGRAIGWLAKSPRRNAKFQWSQLFSPEAAPLRRDPRFFAAMRELGLVEVWRRQGRWPDFCGDLGLRYDCGVEAARSPRAGAAAST